MSAPMVLVTSRSFSSGDQDCAGRLEAAGAQVVHGAPDHDPAALREPLGRATAWIAGAAAVTAGHLAAAPALRVIARYGTGVDSVDLEAASAREIVVTNTPGASSRAVAEHTLALLLSSLRRLVAGDRAVRSGTWMAVRGRELHSLTVGIAGFGRIGRTLHGLLTGLGAHVLVYDPLVPTTEIDAGGQQAAGLHQLAERCDAVSLHAPGGRTLVDERWLACARPGLLLVNAARASLVDENAVGAALRSGVLGGYVTDDLTGAGEGHPLLAKDLADRVLVTPHSAAQTIEAVDAMGTRTTDAVLAVLRGDVPANVVPTPNGAPGNTGST